MTVGGSGGRDVAPQMDVTPLGDTGLVLLIMCREITPLLQKNYWLHLPKQEKEEVTPQQLQEHANPPLVRHVGAGRAIQVNGTDVGLDELSDRLRRMFAARDDHVLFFDASDDAEYGFTVQVMDQARAGGAVTIAALTAALQAPAAATPAP